jgi:hypothetical protein
MKFKSILHLGGVVVGVVAVEVVMTPGHSAPVGEGLHGVVDLIVVDVLVVPEVVDVDVLVVPDVVDVDDTLIGTTTTGGGLHMASVGSMSLHVLHGFSQSPSDPFILHMLNRSCSTPFLYQ